MKANVGVMKRSIAGFETQTVVVGGHATVCDVDGQGDAVLLLHGFPQRG